MSSALPWKPSIQFALCYVIQAMLLVALIGPVAMPILLIVFLPLHVFGVHLYLHGLLAMPRAVHLCILPVTLIMGIVSAIIFGVEFIYLPLSLLCLTVGIRLCSCCGIPSSEGLEPSPSLPEVAPSHPRGTSTALDPSERGRPSRRRRPCRGSRRPGTRRAAQSGAARRSSGRGSSAVCTAAAAARRRSPGA